MGKLNPLGNDVIIHPIEESDKTESGLLYKPEYKKPKVNKGIIIAKGPLVTDELEIGEPVLFNARSGTKITLPNGIFFVLPEPAIECKLENYDVMLVDSVTMKRLITECLGDLRVKYPNIFIEGIDWNEIEDALHNRINDMIPSEGLEF